jgi:putative CocE/NonD family hydrolase
MSEPSTPVFAVSQTQASMLTRDGIRLDADIYRPEGAGPWPVLLMRQPYGRAIASTVVYAHPRWYAAQGYIVVIQDVRGRGTSEGSFYPFAAEKDDGYDTVQWAAALPGSTGQVGMYGFSYQGMTQLYAAAAQPSALKVLCPAMLAYDLCRDMAYENGAFLLANKLGWGIQLEAETARLRGDQEAFAALYRASRQLPLTDPIPCRPQVLQTYAPESFYFDWLAHPDPDDDYWRRFSPHYLLSNTLPQVPMLHIGGWFDPYLRGTLRCYRAMQQTGSPQRLVIGPWGHLPWSRQVGAVDFGPAAVNPVDHLQVAWFNHWLKGDPLLGFDPEPVRLFEMGSNHWRVFSKWPTPQMVPLYLKSNGLAMMAESQGSLVWNPPTSAMADTFVHDPWRPVPALGGHNGLPAGCFDRSSLDGRSDVVTYTTAPLEQDLQLVGEPLLEVYCHSDQPSFDLGAVLSEVKPTGVYNLTQGYGRVDQDPSDQPHQPVRIPLQATCARIPAGHALRLSLSAACFPAHPVNPGTGSPAATATQFESQIITLTLETAGSRLLLPVIAVDQAPK